MRDIKPYEAHTLYSYTEAKSPPGKSFQRIFMLKIRKREPDNIKAEGRKPSWAPEPMKRLKHEELNASLIQVLCPH
jgi:hypothetical protein